MKRLLTLILLLVALHSFSQNTGWSIDPYDDRFFIENIGQWAPIANEHVVAGVDNRGTEIFYTSSGFVYRVRKPVLVPAYTVQAADAEEPDNEAEDRTRRIYDTLQIAAQWIGTTGGQTILESPKAPLFHYSHEGGQLVGAKAYERLSTRNLYDHIDLEYAFHTTEGIKYNLTVHPGGNPADIALVFSGMDDLFLDSEGNVHAQLGEAALIDHAPVAYLIESGESIDIRFVLSGDTLRFEVADYDPLQTLYIDPWIINPGFTTQGKVFDVGWDCGGNAYAFGGSGPWKVRKFNGVGALIWNYNTNHTDWYGDMVTDDLGNVYLVEGCCDGNREKLNPSGVMQWSINNGVYEFWKLTFSCDYSRLTMATAYSASAALTPAQSLSTINMTTGAVTAGTVVSGSEPRSIAPSAAGNYYVVTAVGNEVIGRTNAYGPIYTAGSGYSLLYNGPLYANGGNTTSGSNGIAIYSTFIFTTDGATLMKRNIANGALIASVVIPGGTAEQYSGVAVDNCGNVFVGSNNAVYRYDVNLTPVSSIALTGAVYDVVVSGISTLLIAGNNLLASQVSPCVAPCNTCVITPTGLTNWVATVIDAHQVALQWTTENVDAATQYTVERSADGANYATLQTLVGGQAEYETYDARPLKGYTWYRLAVQSPSGETSYSPARQVWIPDGKQSLSVFPNPATDHIAIQLPPTAKGVLTLVNAQGKVVSETRLKDEGMLSGETELDLATLESGIYTLHIVGMDCVPVKFCVLK